jgi:hypothetical protein
VTTAFSSAVCDFPFPPFFETSDVNFVIFVAAALYVVKQVSGSLFLIFFYLYEVNPKRK